MNSALEILHFQRSGFPHSEIPGSTPVCGSPRLIAAYHVLHRLPSPRHPPYALSSLIITCLWRSALRFVEFAHQYSIVKDLKYPIELQVRCMRIGLESEHCELQMSQFNAHGDDRVRTDGLRSASAALSQLSYIPLPQALINMGLGRVELPTSRLSGVRSNHLSYRPDGVRLERKILRQKTYRRQELESSEEFSANSNNNS